LDTSASLSTQAKASTTAPPGGDAGSPAGRAPRIVAHALFIVAGWVLFFWGWQRVISRGADFSELRLLVFGAMVVVPVVTVSWILHNRGIHRRKGPRRRVPAASLDYRVDFHGREVVADFGMLAGAQRVEIELDGAIKRYRPCATADWRAGQPGDSPALRARQAIEHAGDAPAGIAPAATPLPTQQAPAPSVAADEAAAPPGQGAAS
jgi:hypothetical protein